MTITFGVWQHQGTVIPSGVNNSPQQPSVIYEGNAQILSGNVFKMWYNKWDGSNPNIYYAESTDGVNFTLYGGNPLIAGQGFAKVYKSGSTYYLYSSSGGLNVVNVYTSLDGITFTLAKANALTPGGAGAWDRGFVVQLNIIDIIGGTWYGYYAATSSINGNVPYAMGLATAPDGINWTKWPSNPLITQWGPSNFDWHKINGTYFGWSQIVLPNNPYATDSLSLQFPSDIIRAESVSVTGPFTYLPTPVFQRTQSSEGPDPAHPSGQVADSCMVSDGTNLWVYFTQTANGDSNGVGPWMIGAAKAPNTSMSQLVGTYEGIQSYPVYTLAGLALTNSVIGLDNGQRANESPLSNGGKWVAGTSGDTASANLIGNQIVGTSLSLGTEMYWAIPFNNDQWSQIVVAKALETSSEVGVTLRPHAAAFTEYRVVWIGIAGTSGQLYVQAWVNGANQGNLINAAVMTLNVGDTLTAIINGFTIYVYRNGFFFSSVTDAGQFITSGNVGAGFIVYGGTSNATDAAISAWSGGNLTTIGPIAPSILEAAEVQVWPVLEAQLINTLHP